jgi:hypothetical protein
MNYRSRSPYPNPRKTPHRIARSLPRLLLQPPPSPTVRVPHHDGHPRSQFTKSSHRPSHHQHRHRRPRYRPSHCHCHRRPLQYKKSCHRPFKVARVQPCRYLLEPAQVQSCRHLRRLLQASQAQYRRSLQYTKSRRRPFKAARMQSHHSRHQASIPPQLRTGQCGHPCPCASNP